MVKSKIFQFHLVQMLNVSAPFGAIGKFISWSWSNRKLISNFRFNKQIYQLLLVQSVDLSAASSIYMHIYIHGSIYIYIYIGALYIGHDK